jgi:hypothetical protein
MSKLDEIETKSLNEWVFGDDVTLLIRAVRQLGVERGAFQALFEAVDNDYKTVETHAPEVYGAFLVVTNTAEADPDVLELIGGEE